MGYGRSRRRKRRRFFNSRKPLFVLALGLMLIVLAAALLLKDRASNESLSTEQAPAYDALEASSGNDSEVSAEAFSEAGTKKADTSSEAVMTKTEAPSEAAMEETPAAAKNVRLLFAGDIYFSSFVLDAYDSAGISGILSPELHSLTQKADIFMANLEFALSDRGTPEEEKSFTFRVSPERTHILNELGTDILSLANNHTLDFGEDALLDTIEALDNAGISHTGAGKNSEEAGQAVIKELSGKTFAFLGATRVIPFADWAAGPSHAGLNSIYDPYKEKVFAELESLSEHTDYQIVYVHWGTEEKDTPDEYMRALARELVDAGADLIIGSHPHVLQGMEYIDGVPVIYSLGNFLFGSVIESTMLLQIDWDIESGIPAVSFHPAKGAMGYTEGLTDEKELSSFLEYYESICNAIA